MIKRYDHGVAHGDSQIPESFMCVSDKGAYVDYEDYAALQQKLNAMAAEVNGIREQAEDVYAAGYRHGHLNTADGCAYATPVEDEFYHNALQVMLEVETPATDAYMNSVRADAVSNLWNKSLRDVAHVLNDIRAFDDSSEAAGIVHSEIKERVDDFVESLRSGTHDTADKVG